MSSLPLLYNGKCNVVIPMAGEGSRFSKVGYTFPKPLIDVKGKPMIQAVVENLAINPKTSRFIFIVRRSHYEVYHLSYLLNLIAPGCEIVITDGLTEGAACSVLLAEKYIDNDTPLIIANSDQLVEGWNSSLFMYTMENSQIDGGILTFKSTHPKFSYAKIGEDGFVTEVAEKKPISDLATVGIYYDEDIRIQAVEEWIENNPSRSEIVLPICIWHYFSLIIGASIDTDNEEDEYE